MKKKLVNVDKYSSVSIYVLISGLNDKYIFLKNMRIRELMSQTVGELMS